MNISENLQRILTDKQNIADAINAKGVSCLFSESLDTYANKISQISGGEEPLPEILDTDPLTFVRVDKVIENGYISLENVGSASSKLFEYNKNDEGWKNYTEGTKIPMNYGDKVLFKSSSTNRMSNGTSAFRLFKTIGVYNCGGNVNSLLNYSNSNLSLYCFYRLFYNCNIITSPVLPATALGEYCYSSMFLGCKLIKAPELPATKLSKNCYQYMFLNCGMLIDPPKELPATTLADYCYSSMFVNCSSLIKAPELPATKLVSFCYDYMFLHCYSLKEIYCNAIYSPTGSTLTSFGTNWLNFAPNTTDCIFHKNPELSAPTNRYVNTIPSNWKIVDWVQ